MVPPVVVSHSSSSFESASQYMETPVWSWTRQGCPSFEESYTERDENGTGSLDPPAVLKSGRSQCLWAARMDLDRAQEGGGQVHASANHGGRGLRGSEL